MADRKSVIRQFRKIAEEMLMSGITLRRLALYCSYTKETQKKWSDVDGVFIADEFKKYDLSDAGLLSKVIIKYSALLIQPLTCHPKQFSAGNDPVVKEILRTGIQDRNRNQINS